MKTKILVAILIIVVIALGVLFGLKMYTKNEENKANVEVAEDEESVLTVNLEEKEEIPQSKYSGDKRTLAVVIDNVGEAIPQAGLNDAMIVYEAIVEGGLTRLLAVFKDPQVETIGPARSARPYFIDYALENDSIFAHYGGSPKALKEVEQLNMDNINGIVVSSKIYWRTNKKSAPHNAMLSVEEAWNYVKNQNYRPTTTKRNVLNYVTNEVNLEEGESASSVTIPYPKDKVQFQYNEQTKLYERLVNGAVRKDFTTGESLTTKNIIITFAKNYTTNEENGYGRQAIENIGSLDGYYITNGKAEKIKCEKTARSTATVYKDLNGEEIEVNDGNTYIQIVPLNTNIEFA